jgi:alpha-glucosidase/oligosaccharide 4-alpha-D-glucosyltransferase
MIDRFAKKGVKTVLVTEPFILTTSKKWQDAVDNKILGLNSSGEPYTYDFYFGNTGLIDLYNPNARDWFWDIYKKFINQGIAGWWGDLGEPEVHPGDMQHHVGKGDEIHNAYGHEWAKLIYEGYKKDFPEVRPFILMRAGYAGSQRYGLIPWSGDVNRSWGGLIPQPEIALQMGMQGLAYMHSDLGGFAGGDQIDDELYLRWLQYGIFQPIFRPHAQEHIPAEPVFQNERTKILARQAIELRYKLLPYIYNLAFENHLTGKPLMTPLFFHEKANKSLLTYDSAYMWGNAFLVSPVKSKGEMYQQVYMPSGNNWIDFQTGQRYSGGKHHKIPLAGNYIPVFVKEGAFIPMASHAVNTEKYNLENFELHFYALNTKAESSYTMYNDDGNTPEAYEKNLYELYTFKAVESDENLTITVGKKTDDKEFSKTKNNIKLMVHNLNSRPTSVLINGSKLKSKEISWNPVTYKLILSVECSTNNNEVIIKK